MPVETVTGVQDLNPSWPTSVDPVSEGDDHCRLIKEAIGLSFPNMTAAWVTTSVIKANGFDANGNRIINVATPVDPTDAVRKGDTDALDDRLAALEAQLTQYQSFGNIDLDGSIQGGSGDFSCVRQAAGHYVLTFNEAASGLYDQALTSNVQGFPPFTDDKECNVNYLSPTVVEVYTVSGNNQLQDAWFTFIRMAD